MDEPATEDLTLNRTRAVLAVLPFLFIGLSCLGLILAWGLDGLWGFLILPPILFMCVLAYVAFRSGFVQDRTGEVNPDSDLD